MVAIGTPALAAVGALFTVLSAVAAAAAVLRSSYLKTSVEVLRANNEDLTGRVELLEASRSEDHEKIARLEAEKGALERVVTGRDLLEALAKQLTLHHTETLTRLDSVQVGMTERLDDLKRLAGARRSREVTP